MFGGDVFEIQFKQSLCFKMFGKWLFKRVDHTFALDMNCPFKQYKQ